MSIAELELKTQTFAADLTNEELAQVEAMLENLHAARGRTAPSLADGFGLWQGRRLDSRRFVASLREEWGRA